MKNLCVYIFHSIQSFFCKQSVNMVSIKPGELCFFGEHSFLSNFYLNDIKFKNQTYKSAEHLFQTSKCTKESDREKIRNQISGKLAKIYGKFVDIKPNWEEKRVIVMENILRLKFRKKSKLNRMLRETGDVKLVHLNFWHDTFWGCCACTQHKRSGENMLGVILMKIRAESEMK